MVAHTGPLQTREGRHPQCSPGRVSPSRKAAPYLGDGFVLPWTFRAGRPSGLAGRAQAGCSLVGGGGPVPHLQDRSSHGRRPQGHQRALTQHETPLSSLSLVAVLVGRASRARGAEWAQTRGLSPEICVAPVFSSPRTAWVQKIKAASELYIETEKKKREKAYLGKESRARGTTGRGAGTLEGGGGGPGQDRGRGEGRTGCRANPWGKGVEGKRAAQASSGGKCPTLMCVFGRSLCRRSPLPEGDGDWKADGERGGRRGAEALPVPR